MGASLSAIRPTSLACQGRVIHRSHALHGPFARAIASRRWRRVVMCCGAQTGKTETLLDVIGQRLDQAPCPVMYVGPGRQFVSERFEPRVMQLLDEAPSLAGKVARGKRMTKTRKVIAGVPLFLAHGGSSAALKSESIGLALIDEVDELAASLKGQGDPVGLVDQRGSAYADFVNACVSTPSAGLAEIVTDPDTGLAFWGANSETDSKIWELFQQGTRFHWAWPCPQCSEYFIPRFSCLEIPKNAAEEAVVVCPRCGGTASEKDKKQMNENGVFVAPGQSVDTDGTVRGDVPESETASFWVSGLCSPFRTFSQRAAEYQDAQNSGDMYRVQTVVNASFGELWAPTAGRCVAVRRGNEASGHLRIRHGARWRRVFDVRRRYPGKPACVRYPGMGCSAGKLADRSWRAVGRNSTRPCMDRPCRVVGKAFWRAIHSTMFRRCRFPSWKKGSGART